MARLNSIFKEDDRIRNTVTQHHKTSLLTLTNNNSCIESDRSLLHRLFHFLGLLNNC